MGRDQNHTAARVVHHGAGVRLSPKASSKAIRSAVESVLADPSCLKHARALGDAIASRKGCVDAIDTLERLARSRQPRDAAA